MNRALTFLLSLVYKTTDSLDLKQNKVNIVRILEFEAVTCTPLPQEYELVLTAIEVIDDFENKRSASLNLRFLLSALLLVFLFVAM